MTDHKPLTTQQLTDIDAAIATYQRHAPTGFACCTAHPVADAGAALLAEVRRLQAELDRRTEDLAFMERTTLPEARRDLQHHQAGKQRWRERAEKAEAGLADARANAIELAAAVVDEKLTAEPDHNRASALYELLLNLRGELPCTCARSSGLHSKGCGKYVPGHELISRHNALAAYRAERSAVSAAGESGSTR